MIDLELRPGDDDAAIAVYSPAFISNGQLSILDGKGIFGGRTVRTFDGSTLEDDQGFPFRFSSTTNTMGIVTTTDNTVGIVTSTENTMGIVTTIDNTFAGYVWFRSVYAIRRNDDDSMFDMMPAGK